MYSKVVKMFDVKQTAIKDFDIAGPSNRKVPDAIMNTYPAAVEVQELPDDSYALYDPDDKLIRVKAGLDPATKVFVIAREQAVQIMTDEGRLSREEVIDKAEIAAYIFTKHYGFDAPDIAFGEMSATYPGKEEKDVRAELGGIKFAADRIDARVQEVIEISRSEINAPQIRSMSLSSRSSNKAREI